MFEKLLKSVGRGGGKDKTKAPIPSDFDWALHPGGLTVITGVQETMNLTPDLLRASYDVYVNHGNSSSATVISVMDQLRRMGPGKEDVVACAFGPGISVEMMLLKRKSAVENGEMPAEDLD